MSVIQDQVFIISALYKIAVTEQQAGESNIHQLNCTTSTIELQLDDAYLEQINNTRRRNINPKILPNFMIGLEEKLRIIPIF